MQELSWRMASVGIGERLRSARQALGLSLEEIESVTRIQRPYLAALEQEAFDDLPGPTYVRGFLRAYATYLGIPSEELLRLYPTPNTKVIAHRESPVEVRITPAIRLSPARRVAVGAGILLGLGVLFLGFILYGQIRQFAQTTPASPARTPAPRAGPSSPSVVRTPGPPASTSSPSPAPSVTPPAPGAAPGPRSTGPSPAPAGPKPTPPPPPSPSGGTPGSKPPASPAPGGSSPPASPAPKGSPAPGSPAATGPASGAPPAPSPAPGPGAPPGTPPSPPAPKPGAPPGTPPSPSAAPKPGAPPGPAPSTSPTAPVYVVVLASGHTWVRTVADGTIVFEGFLNAGDKQVWQAKRTLTVKVGNASVVDIALNGRSLGHLGGPGQVYEHTFSTGAPTP